MDDPALMSDFESGIRHLVLVADIDNVNLADLLGYPC
jgi:hypothetical protein